MAEAPAQEETFAESESPLRQLTERFIFSEEPPDEQEPLVRPQRRTDNRERFQRNQRSVARRVLARSSRLIVVGGFVLVIYAVIYLYFYIKGWCIWYWHREKPCDEPLQTWLLLTLLLPLLGGASECVSRHLRLFVQFCQSPFLIVGIVWYYQSETCAETSPILYKFVQDYLIFLSISWIGSIILPMIMIAVLVYGMMRGWFDDINGASPGTVKQMETVPFDPALFAEEGNADDSRPAAECCCCKEDFTAVGTIKRTPCKHYFHEECLERWLRVSTTCPLCRNDLDEAAKAASSGA